MLAAPGKSCPKYIKPIITGPPMDDPEFKKVIDFGSPEGKEFLAYVEKHSGIVSIKATQPNYIFSNYLFSIFAACVLVQHLIISCGYSDGRTRQ